jgi:hypothetical protein
MEMTAHTSFGSRRPGMASVSSEWMDEGPFGPRNGSPKL